MFSVLWLPYLGHLSVGVDVNDADQRGPAESGEDAEDAPGDEKLDEQAHHVSWAMMRSRTSGRVVGSLATR